MSLPTNLTVIQAIEVSRTDAFVMTALAHGVDAAEQDAIARYIAFNVPDGKVIFERCGYKWRSSPWRDSLHIHYLEEPSKRINLLCVNTDTSPRDPWLKKFLGKLFEKLFIAGLVEGAKKGIESSYRYWDTDESRIRVNIFSFEPRRLPSEANNSTIITAASRMLGDAMFSESEPSVAIFYRVRLLLLDLALERWIGAYLVSANSIATSVLGNNTQKMSDLISTLCDEDVDVELGNDDASSLFWLDQSGLSCERAGEATAELTVFVSTPDSHNDKSSGGAMMGCLSLDAKGRICLASKSNANGRCTLVLVANSRSSHVHVGKLPTSRAIPQRKSSGAAALAPVSMALSAAIATVAQRNSFECFDDDRSPDAHTLTSPTAREVAGTDFSVNAPARGVMGGLELWMSSLPLISARRNAHPQRVLA